MPLRTCLIFTISPSLKLFGATVFGPLEGCQTNVRGIYAVSFARVRTTSRAPRDLYGSDDDSTPRARATWSTVVSGARPSIAARTMLCGFVEPRLFVRMSEMPAHSIMARDR